MGRLATAVRKARQFLEFQTQCSYCGRDGLDSARGWDGWLWEMDHVIPRSRGGKDEPSNLVKSCHSCNQAKGDSDLVKPLSWVVTGSGAPWDRNAAAYPRHPERKPQGYIERAPKKASLACRACDRFVAHRICRSIDAQVVLSDEEWAVRMRDEYGIRAGKNQGREFARWAAKEYGGVK